MTREKPKPHTYPLLPLCRLWNGFSQFVYIPTRTRTHAGTSANLSGHINYNVEVFKAEPEERLYHTHQDVV